MVTERHHRLRHRYRPRHRLRHCPASATAFAFACAPPPLQGLCLSSAACFLALALALRPFSALGGAVPFGAVVALSAAAGLLRGGLDPLFFELATEFSYALGIPPGTAGAVLTLWVHLVMIR